MLQGQKGFENGGSSQERLHALIESPKARIERNYPEVRLERIKKEAAVQSKIALIGNMFFRAGVTQQEITSESLSTADLIFLKDQVFSEVENKDPELRRILSNGIYNYICLTAAKEIALRDENKIVDKRDFDYRNPVPKEEGNPSSRIPDDEILTVHKEIKEAFGKTEEYDAAIYAKLGEAINNLGLTIEQYYELISGRTIAQTRIDMRRLQEKLAPLQKRFPTNSNNTLPVYGQRVKQLTASDELGDIKNAEDLAQALLEQEKGFGIDTNDFQKKHRVVQTIDNMKMQSAACYEFEYLTEDEKKIVIKRFPHLSDNELFQAIINNEISSVIVERNGYMSVETKRLRSHEAGHSLQKYLRDQYLIAHGLKLKSAFGCLGSVRDFFSIPMEHAIDIGKWGAQRINFLFLRYLGAAEHELKRLELAWEAGTNPKFTLADHIEQGRKSYQDTLGKILNCEVPEERWAADWGLPFMGVIDGMVNYVEAEIFRVGLSQVLNKFSSPKEKNKLHQQLAYQLTQVTTLEEAYKLIGIKREAAEDILVDEILKFYGFADTTQRKGVTDSRQFK